MKYFFLIIINVLLINLLLKAEYLQTDSLKTYRLGEIITTADKNKNIEESTIKEINYYKIQSSDAVSLSDLKLYIPSGLIQTNSRGETMLFLRGAGERQLGLFFDGVEMNIPWDNRMDLSLIPTDIIGNISINYGANSILYDSNILGGAVNINTIERKNSGIGLTARVQASDAAGQSYSITNDARVGNFNYIANVSYLNDNGFLLSKDDYIANLPNQIANSKIRTNTDNKRLSAYARAEYRFSDNTTLGLSLNHINATKGVAPYVINNPKHVRYWRYPDWQRTILTMNGEHIFSSLNNLKLRATLWFDKFNQTIDSYKDFSYTDLDETQKDIDNTFGERISLLYNFSENHSLTYAMNGIFTKHNEKIISDNETSTDFSQNNLSTGLAYNGKFDNIHISSGITYDINQNPLTGDFIDFRNQKLIDYGAYLELKYNISEDMGFYASSSRRTRFPTLRESFSGAMNKFKVNPNLKPESGLLNEFGFSINKDDWSCRTSVFYNSYNDLIQKIRLSEEEDSLRRKMRVNYSTAVISGIELSFAYDGVKNLHTETHLTYMNSTGKNQGQEVEHLEYKPVYTQFILMNYKFKFGLISQLEFEYTGTQYGIDLDGIWQKIKPSSIINFRLSYQTELFNSFVEFYVRGNNLLDESSYSKIGLINPGRMFYSGVILRI